MLPVFTRLRVPFHVASHHAQKKEPQLVEEERTALFMRSTTCNDTMRQLLLDLYKIHGPGACGFGWGIKHGLGFKNWRACLLRAHPAQKRRRTSRARRRKGRLKTTRHSGEQNRISVLFVPRTQPSPQVPVREEQRVAVCAWVTHEEATRLAGVSPHVRV